jgi:stage V sporulation protein D (sporulation-specific penicillin-binding protein)
MGTALLFTKFEDYYDAVDVDSLTLTIDATVQYYLEKHLEQAIRDYDVQNGAAAIAMDPETGGILGLVSLGNFDLNNYQMVAPDVQEEIDACPDEEEAKAMLAAAQYKQWRNKAVSDTYEPGSTFKIITLATALEEGVVSQKDSFFCGGSVDVPGRNDPVKCWRTNGHGAQTLIQAVQHSCNVAFVNIGLRIGEETFYKYCEAFGFFKASENHQAQLTGLTGINLPGESGSIWWSRDVFCNPQNLSQLAAASFGQTFNITPLQLITAVSACVNGGYLMKPYIVSSVAKPDGEVVSNTEPTAVRQVISEETSAEVRSILEQVVSDRKEGTGKNAYVAGYRIGGKTGTSTNTTTEAVTGEKKYITSFIGFAPADDPKIVILVLLDSPTNDPGIYISGGQMAAPTVGKIMSDVLPYLGVEAEYTDDELRLIDKTVPSVGGMSLAEAQSVLTAGGLAYRVIGNGNTVTGQLPAAGAAVAAKSQVILYTDTEPSAEREEMPDLTGLTYEIARDRLGYYGLYIHTDSAPYYESQTVQISRQSIEARTEVEHGTIVEVTLTDYDNSIYGRY